ncbi:MAG: hypothetical protein Q6363_004665 [Candidatus Njordarchaeota archaeon]
MRLLGASLLYVKSVVHKINKAISEYIQLSKKINLSDNTMLLNKGDYFVVIDTTFLDNYTREIRALYMEQVISKIRSMYPGKVYFIFISMFATLSALEKAITDKHTLIYVVSIKRCIGISHMEFETFADFFKTYIDNDLLELFQDNDQFKYYQLAELNSDASAFFYRLWYALASRFDSMLLMDEVKEIFRLIEKHTDEIRINNHLIKIFNMLGLKVDPSSNKPGFPDIILKDLKIIFEIKTKGGSYSALQQAYNYKRTYGDDYIVSLVVTRISSGIIDEALLFGISLITFEDLTKLIKLISLFGISHSNLRKILIPGMASQKIAEALNKYMKRFYMLVDLLKIGIRSHKLYVNQIADAIASIYNRRYNIQEISESIEVFRTLPLDMIALKENSLIFNEYAICNSLPRFIIKLISEVMRS